MNKNTTEKQLHHHLDAKEKKKIWFVLTDSCGGKMPPGGNTYLAQLAKVLSVISSFWGLNLGPKLSHLSTEPFHLTCL